MLARARTSIPSILDDMRTFERMAELLHMPIAERLSVLNMSEPDYAQWQAGKVQPPRAELIRRLGYALPLMRQMVANASVVHVFPDKKVG